MSFLKAFIFGVTLAATIGPIAILIMNNGINRGFIFASRSALGAALADLTFALVAFILGATISSLILPNSFVLRLFSAAVLISFGLWLIYQAFHKASADTQYDRPTGVGFIGTYLLTVSNPLGIIIFLGFAAQVSGSSWSARQVIQLSLAVFLGSSLVQFALAGFGSSLKRHLTHPSALRAVNVLSGVIVVAFGVLSVVAQ